MHRVVTLPLLVALLALVSNGAAAAVDLRTRRIPSWLTLPALLLGPALHVVVASRTHARGALGLSGPALEGALSLVGAAACAIVPLGMWRAGLMGGGDGKLLASSGALLGVSVGVRVELVALLLAGYFGLARLAFRGQLTATLTTSVTFVLQRLRRSPRPVAAPTGMTERLPLGPFVLAATVLVLLWPFARQSPLLAGPPLP